MTDIPEDALREKAQAVYQRLYQVYGEPDWDTPSPPLDELVNTILSQNTNDRNRVEAELQRKLPAVLPGYGYCLHSDHSIPVTVNYDVYRYFVDRGREIGTYK
jgi:hypothetical protein